MTHDVFLTIAAVGCGAALGFILGLIVMSLESEGELDD